jgi:putative alpha-1,2-mannosidase
VRQILTTLYNDTPDGLCGNDDCGQMSAWYVLSALGFYPVSPIDGNYVIGSPLFEHAAVQLGHGRVLEIDAPGATSGMIYVKGATLDGQRLDHPWFSHAQIARGGVLTLEMSATPAQTWASSNRQP